MLNKERERERFYFIVIDNAIRINYNIKFTNIMYKILLAVEIVLSCGL